MVKEYLYDLRQWWSERPEFPKFWRKPTPLPPFDGLVTDVMLNADFREELFSNITKNNPLLGSLKVADARAEAPAPISINLLQQYDEE